MLARTALAALALSVIAASSVQAPVLAAAPERVRSHCRNGELTIYNCDYGAQVLSVCDDHGSYSYRYGPPGAPALTITSTGRDGKLHTAETTGTGGAAQTQMRFTRGTYNYIVFAGDSLPYREGGPGRSGVTILAAGKVVQTKVCPDRSPNQLMDLPFSVDLDGGEQEMVAYR